jgi:hypothetical protein
MKAGGRHEWRPYDHRIHLVICILASALVSIMADAKNGVTLPDMSLEQNNHGIISSSCPQFIL